MTMNYYLFILYVCVIRVDLIRVIYFISNSPLNKFKLLTFFSQVEGVLLG